MVMESNSSRRAGISFAVLAGIVVVAAFMATQFPPRPMAPAAPVGVVSLPPIAINYGAPPPGVPLVWVQDPNHTALLIGFDWTGKPRGTVKVAQLGQYDKLSQAPDGSALGIEANGKGGFHVYLDRLGNLNPSPASTLNYQYEMWADDSRHVCTLDFLGGHWNLGLMLLGAASNPVHEVALDPSSLARSGIIAFSFAACSARNDRAVITYFYPGRPTQYSVVRISDGAVLQQPTYAAGLVASVTASMDGSLIAESSGQSAGEPAPNAAATVIRRASDLSVVTTLAPSDGVLAFSGDNSSALVTTAPWIAGQPTMLEVIDWQTGKVTWQGEGTSPLGTFAIQPGGNAFAIALTSDNLPATILVVYGDGTKPAKLPWLLIPAW
jgi:hypothetical protein